MTPADIRDGALLRLLGDILQPDMDPAATGAMRLRLMGRGFSWQALVDLARGQGVLLPMIFTLTTRGLLPPMPRVMKNREIHVTAKLGTLYQHHLARRRAETRQLEGVLQTFHNTGVVPLVLKGARYLVDPVGSWCEARAMADFDILVPARDAEVAFAALKARGYQPVSYTHLDVYKRQGERSRRPVADDLHPDNARTVAADAARDEEPRDSRHGEARDPLPTPSGAPPRRNAATRRGASDLSQHRRRAARPQRRTLPGRPGGILVRGSCDGGLRHPGARARRRGRIRGIESARLSTDPRRRPGLRASSFSPSPGPSTSGAARCDRDPHPGTFRGWSKDHEHPAHLGARRSGRQRRFFRYADPVARDARPVASSDPGSRTRPADAEHQSLVGMDDAGARVHWRRLGRRHRAHACRGCIGRARQLARAVGKAFWISGTSPTRGVRQGARSRRRHVPPGLQAVLDAPRALHRRPGQSLFRAGNARQQIRHAALTGLASACREERGGSLAAASRQGVAAPDRQRGSTVVESGQPAARNCDRRALRSHAAGVGEVRSARR